MAHEGGCLCGKLRFRVNAAPLVTGYCHCRLCQLNSGAPVVAWATFPQTSFNWVRGEAGSYAASQHGRRFFCRDCGSYVVFSSARAPEEVSVNTASFDDPSVFPPESHIYAASRIVWFDTADTLPRHADGLPEAP